MPPRECQLEYIPCFFEFKSKRPFAPIIIWMLVGTVCVLIFSIIISTLQETIDLFTTLYFVGGIGWVPAVLCLLSHIFYKMSVVTYPFFSDDTFSPQDVYSKAAKLIFGYVKQRQNRIISVLIWIAMVATITFLGPTFNSSSSAANVFICFVYVIVGFVFSAVICGIINFIIYLMQLQKQEPLEFAFHRGIVERLRINHTCCIWLNWSTVVLFGLLALAMFRSPFGQKLWWWLPVLGFFPLGLFISSNYATTTLIRKSLHFEEKILCDCITAIMGTPLSRTECIMLQALIDIQNKLREYAESKHSTAEWFLFLFTLMSAVGSILGAVGNVFPYEVLKQLFVKR